MGFNETIYVIIDEEKNGDNGLPCYQLESLIRSYV